MLLLLSSLVALGATEEQISKHFQVQPGGTVVVEVDFGGIEIQTNAASEVVVDVWRKISCSSKAKEEAFLKDNPVELVQDGKTITIRSHHQSNVGSSFWGKNQNDAKYVISVPGQFNARPETSGGSISVSGLSGEVKAHTGGGSIDLARLHGPLDAATGGGSIKAADCEGNIRLHSGGGGLEIAGGSGSLEGETGGGSISVKHFQGTSHLRTGGGSLDIEKVDGALDAATGGGSIHLVMPSELSGDLRLSTGGGGIHVAVPESAAFDLDAQSYSGSVHCDVVVAVSGKADPGCLRGPVNGGGKPVVLRTGGGSIRISKL